jgi:Fic-DOC domain mobile mystery protein B
VTDLFQEPQEAMPLTPEEREGLLQSWITHRRDVNEAEQENILKGAAWARSCGRRSPDLLSVDFALMLHKRMFGEVWAWAGAYRQTARNIGIDAYRIPAEMPVVFDNARYWVPPACPCPSFSGW